MSRRKPLRGDGGGEGTMQSVEVVRQWEMGVTGTESCVDGGAFSLGPLKEPEGPLLPPRYVSDTETALLSLSFPPGSKGWETSA